MLQSCDQGDPCPGKLVLQQRCALSWCTSPATRVCPVLVTCSCYQYQDRTIRHKGSHTHTLEEREKQTRMEPTRLDDIFTLLEISMFKNIYICCRINVLFVVMSLIRWHYRSLLVFPMRRALLGLRIKWKKESRARGLRIKWAVRDIFANSWKLCLPKLCKQSHAIFQLLCLWPLFKR